MQSKASTVDEYLKEIPLERLSDLERLRALIREVAPTAVEAMEYGAPCYRVGGEILCSFASQKQNMALYICDIALVNRYRTRLGTKDIGKSCIRFRKLEKLALEPVRELLAEAYRLALEGALKTGC